MRSKSSVRVATLTARGELGHRGARERVSEGESPIRIDTHQPRSLGGTEPLQVHLPGGGLQDAEIPGAIEDGQQEQVPRSSGQPGDSRHAKTAWRRSLRGRVCGATAREELSMLVSAAGSSKRASGLPCDSARSRWRTRGASAGKRSASNAVEAASSSGPRSWPRSPLRSKKLSSPERDAARNPTRVAMKSTCDKPEHKRAGSIHPLQVVDDHQQGFLRARLRQQRQSRVANHELIRRWAIAQTQRHLERRALRWVQSFDFVKEGVQNLIQPSEAEVRLEFRAQRRAVREGRHPLHELLQRPRERSCLLRGLPTTGTRRRWTTTGRRTREGARVPCPVRTAASRPDGMSPPQRSSMRHGRSGLSPKR